MNVIRNAQRTRRLGTAYGVYCFSKNALKKFPDEATTRSAVTWSNLGVPEVSEMYAASTEFEDFQTSVIRGPTARSGITWLVQ